MKIKLQGADEGLELCGDFCRRSAWGERDRGTDANGDFAEVGEAAVGALHFPHAVEAHRDDGNA
jgi:hypothetical protein